MTRSLVTAAIISIMLAACGAGGTPGNYRKGACGAVDAGQKSLDHLAAAVEALDTGNSALVGEEVELARIDAHVAGGQISYIPRDWAPGDATREVLTNEVQQPLDDARALFPDPRAGSVDEVPELQPRDRAKLEELMQRVRAGLDAAQASLRNELSIDCEST